MGYLRNHLRNPHTRRILSLRGKLSYSMIADKLGISRSAVAGVCWRAARPSERMNGRGHHGPGKEAKRTLRRVS
jgi:hypothetical protein